MSGRRARAPDREPFLEFVRTMSPVLFGRPVPLVSRASGSYWLLAFALTAGALGAGAIHVSLLSAFAVLVIASALLAASLPAVEAKDPDRSGFSWREATLVGSCLLLSVVCLLQSVPLPRDWLEALSPQAADLWSQALRPLDAAPPERASLSLAPRRGVIEALKFACYALVFGISAQLSRQLDMWRMAAIAFGAALSVSFVTAAHRLIGAEALYGAYQPLDAQSVAPLLNANSRAGYLNLGFFCGLGLLLRSGTRPYSALIGLGLAFVAAEILLCLSMGATGCLATGLLLVLLLPRKDGRRRQPFELSRWAQAGMLLCIGLGATIMALVAGSRRGLGLDDQSLEKLELASKSAQLALDYWRFGIGRGAFGSMFAEYQGIGEHRIFEHAENLPLQWAAEWGIPVTVAALAALAWALAPIVQRRSFSSPTRRCTVVGCAMLLMQNMVDLGLEIPAIAAMLCAMLGALCGVTRRSGSRREVPMGPRRRVVLAVGSALASICLVLALTFGVESTGRLRQDLYTHLSTSQGLPSESFWSALREAIKAYPAEPYFPLLGSSAALRAGQNPLPWIARALERNPSSAQAHLQLGRILQAGGATSQALGALRRAIELDARQAGTVVSLGTTWHLSPMELGAAAPHGRAGAPLLSLLATRTSDPESRLQLLEQSLERDPAQVNAHYLVASELLHDLQRKTGAVLCTQQRDACLTRAKKHAKLAATAGDSRAGILESRLIAEEGNPSEAEAHLSRVCEQFPGDLACADARAARAVANQSPRLPEAVNALIALGCSNRERCSKTHVGLGNLFASAKQWHLALGHYRKAAQEAPSAATWLALAGAAEQLGQDAVAADARRRIRLLEGANPAHAAPHDAPSTTPSGHPLPNVTEDTPPGEHSTASE